MLRRSHHLRVYLTNSTLTYHVRKYIGAPPLRTRPTHHMRGLRPTWLSSCCPAHPWRPWGRPCALSNPLSPYHSPTTIGIGRRIDHGRGLQSGLQSIRPRRHHSCSWRSCWRRGRWWPPVAGSRGSWARRARCRRAGSACGGSRRRRGERRVCEHQQMRSGRPRMGVRA